MGSLHVEFGQHGFVVSECFRRFQSKAGKDLCKTPNSTGPSLIKLRAGTVSSSCSTSPNMDCRHLAVFESSILNLPRRGTKRTVCSFAF